MILSKYVFMKISPANFRHWKSKGYDMNSTGGRAAKNTGQRIKVLVTDLLSGSNANVSCKCDECGSKYIQRFCRNTNVCYPCRKSSGMMGNSFGSKNKGKKVPCMSGENHPRWNPNKSEYAKYASRVRSITEETYEKHKHIINPDDLPRTLCGVDGGYQLDHKISIKWGFYHGANPKVIGGLSNLQMLSWQENRQKW